MKVECCDICLVSGKLTRAKWVKKLQDASGVVKWQLCDEHRHTFDGKTATESLTIYNNQMLGHKWRVVAWIHPKSGDDRKVEQTYKDKPTDKEIAQLLKGSEIKTDYVVEEIKEAS